MAGPSYRTQAKEALARAHEQLAAKNLRYAALELRMAMEALTYDRARAYAKEIPPKEMATWQPSKVMQALLEIEPAADQSYSVSLGEEPYPGGKPDKMHFLGTETVFSLAQLQKHYHAVGSVLHTPTMHQIEKGKPIDQAKLQARLELIAQDLSKALSSPIYNFTLGEFSTIDCMRCGDPIRKRMPPDKDEVQATCFSCEARYFVGKQDGKAIWKPQGSDWACRTPGCDEVFTLWRDMFKDGASWACPSCKAKYRIGFGVYTDDPLPEKPTDGPASPS
jgi:hypothetical protein